MVRLVPGSLSEGAGSPQGLTEGVSPDGCFGPTVCASAHINSEIHERLRSSKYTPSVSHPLDSSLREGAGKGCTIHTSARKPECFGRFSSPLRKLRRVYVLPFNGRHSLSFAFAQQLPQRGSRAGWYHLSDRPEAATLRAIFIAPTGLLMFYFSPSSCIMLL